MKDIYGISEADIEAVQLRQRNIKRNIIIDNMVKETTDNWREEFDKNYEVDEFGVVVAGRRSLTKFIQSLIDKSKEEGHKEGYSEGGLNQFQREEEVIKDAVDKAKEESYLNGYEIGFRHGKMKEASELIDEIVQEERERIIEIVKTEKQSFMVEDTQKRFIKAIS